MKANSVKNLKKGWLLQIDNDPKIHLKIQDGLPQEVQAKCFVPATQSPDLIGNAVDRPYESSVFRQTINLSELQDRFKK